MIAELRDFHQFLAEKLGGTDAELSPEEALDEWRRLHPQPEALDEDLAALQEAIDDMAKGDRGIPFDQFDRDFRKRRKVPAKP